jgi:hypothetical protein
MLFLHFVQQVMSLTVINHLTGVIASIDTSGAQQAIMHATHSMVSNVCPVPGNPPGGTMKQVTTFVTDVENTVKTVAAGCFVIGISIGAIMRMLAFGSDRRVAMSSAALTAAIVGLAIFLAASGIQSYLGMTLCPAG